MTAKTTHQNITLYPEDNSRLANLCGLFDENLRHIESHMKVEISNRGNAFRIKGSQKNELQDLSVKNNVRVNF